MFNKLSSDERFVALMPRLLLPSYLLLHWFSGQRSGIYHCGFHQHPGIMLHEEQGEEKGSRDAPEP